MELTYIFLQLLTTLVIGTSACPHALDWVKTPPEERAKYAPMVVVGYVSKSYKDQADKDTSYAVDFKIVRILKGEDIIAKLPQDNNTKENIYRITNFGSMLRCFADLDEEHVFMLFLKLTSDGGLSGKYSDLFDAAEVWTMDMEDKVILINSGMDHRLLKCI